MNNNLQFSVLMSVYYKDNPIWLKEAIDSVLNNTVKADEVVVAIDGPIGEELKQILENYEKTVPNFRNIFLSENKGRGDALNKVLPMCKYDFVALMDADDISLPNRFELELKEFEQDETLSIVGGYIQEFDSDTNENLSIRKVPLTKGKIYKYVKYRSPINQPTVMFRKNNILSVGGYDPKMRYGQDYHLWIRAVALKLNIKNIDKVLVNFRVNSNLFARRGGYKYFKLNKIFQDELLKYRLINYFEYIFNLFIRFCVQVLMPSSVRSLFYKKILRK